MKRAIVLAERHAEMYCNTFRQIGRLVTLTPVETHQILYLNPGPLDILACPHRPTDTYSLTRSLVKLLCPWPAEDDGQDAWNVARGLAEWVMGVNSDFA